MAITGLAHVQVTITAGGEDTARAFYGRLLGLVEVTKPASLSDRGGCWFAAGQQEIHCGVDETVPVGRHHPALLTDDLASLRGELEGAGVRTTDDRPLPGYSRFYANDPFGNRIEFMQRVASK